MGKVVQTEPNKLVSLLIPTGDKNVRVPGVPSLHLHNVIKDDGRFHVDSASPYDDVKGFLIHIFKDYIGGMLFYRNSGFPGVK